MSGRVGIVGAEVVLAYMDEHPQDLKPEITAAISSQLSLQVKDNPYAQRRSDQVTPEEVLNSRMVVYPFRELEICVYSEGAAALILAEEETALAISRNNGTPVFWITGLGEANEHSFAGKNQKVMSRIFSDRRMEADHPGQGRGRRIRAFDRRRQNPGGKGRSGCRGFRHGVQRSSGVAGRPFLPRGHHRFGNRQKPLNQQKHGIQYGLQAGPDGTLPGPVEKGLIQKSGDRASGTAGGGMIHRQPCFMIITDRFRLIQHMA